MKPGRMMLTEKDFDRISKAVLDKRPDEIYIQYPDSRISVMVRKTSYGMRIKAVADCEGKTRKKKFTNVENLRMWLFSLRCSGCAYSRSVSASGQQKVCHYLLDTGHQRERDPKEGVCMSKSDVRRVVNWDLSDLCQPMREMD